MPTIEINIRDNLHRISCDDGEEKHLQNLVSKFREQVSILAKSLPNADDKTLYLIAGLTFIDKLEEKSNNHQTSYETINNDNQCNNKFIDNINTKLETLIDKIEQSQKI